MISKLAMLVAPLLFATAASAVPINISDTYTPTASPLITTTNPFSFTLNEVIANNFLVGTDNFTNGTLTIFVNDHGNGNSSESFTFTLGQGTTLQTSDGSDVGNGATNTAYPITLLAALGDLNDDGKLNVKITASSGDITFVSAKLDATLNRGTVVANDLPEPATLALFGLGLLGFAAARRKSAK